MVGVTYRGYVVDATIRNTTSMGQREGAQKVFDWGSRPAGQSRAFTREIRQGGVVA